MATPSKLSQWATGVSVAITIALLSWIGISNLQSLSFQAAVLPKVEQLVEDGKETRKTVADIKLEMTDFATKEELVSAVANLENRIREMELELTRLKVKAGIE